MANATVMGNSVEMKAQLLDIEIGRVIAAFRDAQTSLIGAEEYTPDGRYLRWQICEWLSLALKESPHRFWQVYRMWGGDACDETDDIMDKVFVTLGIDSVDSIFQMLS